MPDLRLLIPIAIVTAAVAVSVGISLRPTPEPENPSGRTADLADAGPDEGLSSGASHGESRPEDPLEPRPGDPWPAARREEYRYLELHSVGGTRVTRAQVPDLQRQAEYAFRYVRGDYGNAPGVWDGFWREFGPSLRAPAVAHLEVLTQLSPESPFASSFDEYAAIRGGRYFQDPRLGRFGDYKYDPDVEIPGFTAWIEKYPGHPGQDDACYRLGRCFGIRGDGRRALHWFRRAQDVPDGDMKSDARCWELLLLDALLTMDELRAEADTGDPEAMYSLGVRLFRRGDPAAAARLIQAAIPGWPADSGNQPRRQLERIRFIGRLMGRGDQYELGRWQYRYPGLYENLLWDEGRMATLDYEGVLWGWGHDGAPDAFRKEWRLASHRLQARETFLAFLDGNPGPEVAAKARFSATTALGHTQGGHFEQRTVRCPNEVRVQLAEEYAAIARDFPGSSLADDALVFSGLYSGDPASFGAVVSRYPNGDMVDRAEREYRWAVDSPPHSVDDLARWIDRIASARTDEWRASYALLSLDRWLPFCTGRIVPLRGKRREREIKKLVRWFADVRGKLEFDRTVGVYVVR